MRRSEWGLRLVRSIGGILGLVYTLIVARAFGFSDEAEAFFAASTIVLTLNGLTQAGTISSLVLPVYLQEKTEVSDRSASRFFWAVFNWLVLAVILLMVAILVFSSQITELFAGGFSPSTKRLTNALFLWILPAMGFIPLQGMLTMAANANDIYAKFTFVPLVVRSIAVITVALTYFKLGIWALVLGVWIQYIPATIYMFWMINSIGMRYCPVLTHQSRSIPETLKPLLVSVVFIICSQIFAAVFSNAVSQLPRGGYAVLHYAKELAKKIQNLSTGPISQVLSIEISKTALRSSKETIALLTSAMKRFNGVALITLSALISVGQPAIELIFSNEQLNRTNLKLCYFAVVCLAFSSLYFLGPSKLYLRINVARKKPIYVYALNSIYELVWSLIAWLTIPLIGLAAAVAVLCLMQIAKWIGSATLNWYFTKERPVFYSKKELFKSMLLYMLLFSWAIFAKNNFSDILNYSWLFKNNLVRLSVEILAVGTSGVAIFLVAASLLRINIRRLIAG